MKTRSVFLALVAAAIVPVTALGQTAVKPCDPEDRKAWVEVYTFPLEKEKGMVLTVSKETLSDPRRIRPGLKGDAKADHATWLADALEDILEGGIKDVKVMELKVYRKCNDDAHIEFTTSEKEEGGPKFKQIPPRKTRVVFSRIVRGIMTVAGFFVPGVGVVSDLVADKIRGEGHLVTDEDMETPRVESSAETTATVPTAVSLPHNAVLVKPGHVSLKLN